MENRTERNSLTSNNKQNLIYNNYVEFERDRNNSNYEVYSINPPKINNDFSKEINISTKIKDNEFSKKPKLLMSNLPPEFRLKEQRNFSNEKFNIKKIINKRSAPNGIRTNESPNDFESDLKSQTMRKDDSKNNFFRNNQVKKSNIFQLPPTINNSSIYKNQIENNNINNENKNIGSGNTTNNNFKSGNDSIHGYGTAKLAPVFPENNFFSEKKTGWGTLYQNKGVNDGFYGSSSNSFYQKNFIKKNDLEKNYNNLLMGDKKYNNIFMLKNENSIFVRSENDSNNICEIKKILDSSRNSKNNSIINEQQINKYQKNFSNKKKKICENNSSEKSNEQEFSNTVRNKKSKLNSNLKNYILQDINKEYKKIVDNINEGIAYRLNNGYKYYFNLFSVNLYILKEVKNSQIEKINYNIKEWNKLYSPLQVYLSIYGTKKDYNTNQSTIIIEYPIGGENLNDMVNSIGFNNKNILLNIIKKIYENISILEKDNYQKFFNVPFCLCDIFCDIYNEIKIIPPVIRIISINEKNKDYKKCLCKNYLEKLIEICEINYNSISHFCLGLCIFQLITQNLIFKMDSFQLFINNHKNNDYKKCCLLHSLLTIEIKYCDRKNTLLLKQFIDSSLYPKALIPFLHDCTSFNEKNLLNSYERLNKISNNSNDIKDNLDLSLRELLKITRLPENEFCSFENFLKKFDDSYKKMKVEVETFNKNLKENKIISTISRAFNKEKEETIKEFFKIMKYNENDNYNFYESFLNTKK